MVVEPLPVGRPLLSVDDGVVANERTCRHRRHRVCHRRAVRRICFGSHRRRVPSYRSSNCFDDTSGNRDWKSAVRLRLPCRPCTVAYKKWSSSGS